jgi:hypothetical protein
MIEVHGIPERFLTDFLWGFAEPFIKASCDGAGTENSSHIYAWIKNQSAQLWIVTEDDLPIAACVTEIQVFPKMKICTVRHYGGRLDQEIYKTLSGVVSSWAKAHDCERLQLLGRPGWQKLAGNTVSRSFFVLQTNLTGE